MQGAKIFRLGEMCRKLETEQEKVLPFYASSLMEEEEQQAKAAQLEEPTEPLAKVTSPPQLRGVTGVE
jgi:hypothetical protein